MSEKYFLGIDTSNYTTSAAICSSMGEILLNCKIPLAVKEGERGLRQSDAVFLHTKNLPEAAGSIGEFLRKSGISPSAVGVSSTPRDSVGSYMPCFLAGVSAASFASEMLGIPMYRCSHQAGHVMAALYSACSESSLKADTFLSDKFVAFHVSGGTTDVLLCEPDEENILKITQIGGTKDLNAGQLIDRVGVYMGLRFPCGAQMDKAALSYVGKLEKTKISADGTWCNLSGAENKAKELYDKNQDIAMVSAFTFGIVSKTLEKLTGNIFERYGKLPVIYAGGVMSSSYIKKTLQEYGMFATPACSSDNAVGVALIAAETYKRKNG